ncbi:MAG: prepilin-type N-terminal cleavage/methylation domain-containing protein [Planctomycetota bacterium]|nr:MAG: prepilin-type N-terminal cleavage/methylation domain-containing protein [Planctomycetota bacterium]
MKTRTKGFTLIELLVVISIIALLIGILLPALGEAKRKAQMLQNVANLGEYGKGMKIYVTENRGRMPNIPEGSADNTLNQYIPGKPATNWANRSGSTDPDSPSGGAPLAHNGFAFAPAGLQYEDVWRFPNIAFGDYISDGTGYELLTDVHTSPGSSTARNWDAIKEGFDPAVRPFEDKFQAKTSGNGSQPVGWFQGGWYAAENTDEDNTLWALQGDYRYTWAALFGDPAFQQIAGGAQNYWIPQNPNPGGPGARLDVPWNLGRAARGWRAYIQESQFDFLSDKVIFWEHFAWLSRRAAYPGSIGTIGALNIYFMPNAEIPVTTGDGSARVIKPFDVMPDQQQSSDAYQDGVGWGTQLHYPIQSNHPTQQVGQALGLVGPSSKPFAWFIATDFGPRGRDLAGGSGS